MPAPNYAALAQRGYANPNTIRPATVRRNPLSDPSKIGVSLQNLGWNGNAIGRGTTDLTGPNYQRNMASRAAGSPITAFNNSLGYNSQTKQYVNLNNSTPSSSYPTGYPTGSGTPNGGQNVYAGGTPYFDESQGKYISSPPGGTPGGGTWYSGPKPNPDPPGGYYLPPGTPGAPGTEEGDRKAYAMSGSGNNTAHWDEQKGMYVSDAPQGGGGDYNYNLPIPANNPVGGPTSPTSAVPTTLADFARQAVQKGVHNSARNMYANLPGLKQMSTPGDFKANMDLGSRLQKLSQQHNLQNMNVTLSTTPLDEQLNRYIMRSAAGVDQAGLLRNQQNLTDQYNLANMGRGVDAVNAIYRRKS